MKLIFLSTVVLTLAAAISAQTAKGKKAAVDVPAVVTDTQSGARSSAAYAEVVLRRAEAEAELESLVLDFTDEYPKVKVLRYTIGQLQKQGDMLAALKLTDHPKLTLALGKLLVKRTEFETDLWILLQNFADGHPDVKKARKKVEIFDRAIKEILG